MHHVATLLESFSPSGDALSAISRRLPDGNDTTLDRSLIMGMLYMMHVEWWYEPSAKHRPKKAPIQEEMRRIFAMTRWTCCRCFGCGDQNCKLQWNFSGDNYGMWKIRSGSAIPTCQVFLCHFEEVCRRKWPGDLYFQRSVGNIDGDSRMIGLDRCQRAWLKALEHRAGTCPWEEVL